MEGILIEIKSENKSCSLIYKSGVREKTPVPVNPIVLYDNSVFVVYHLLGLKGVYKNVNDAIQYCLQNEDCNIEILQLK